jgi:hypothetical protein
MFVLNPDPFLLPAYRISPFKTSDVSFNHTLPVSNIIDDYFEKRFDGKRFYYTTSGRSAINIALSSYNLAKEDVVTILTSTNNFYISSCVTNEIEKFCLWSRKIERDTKVIFVNHEFGIPYPHIESLKEYRLPIIEDCCTAFFSEDGQNKIGMAGDFTVYSFPKIMPVQTGGLLVCNRNQSIPDIKKINPSLLQYIKNVLSYHIGDKESIFKSRMGNYNLLKEKLHPLGFKERFVPVSGVLPSVYMFRKEDVEVNLDQLKIHLNNHGIQCSVFYGEESFFIPAHQNLNMADLDYFVEAIRSFIKTPIK